MSGKIRGEAMKKREKRIVVALIGAIAAILVLVATVGILVANQGDTKIVIEEVTRVVKYYPNETFDEPEIQEQRNHYRGYHSHSHCIYRWHSEGTLSDGTLVGKLGAMTYILSSESGMPISDGFHEITPTKDGYDAKTGSIEFKLNKDGQILWTTSSQGYSYPYPSRCDHTHSDKGHGHHHHDYDHSEYHSHHGHSH